MIFSNVVARKEAQERAFRIKKKGGKYMRAKVDVWYDCQPE